ncbi:MAG: nucleotidyl transferase AbiEii/AbiGii toxin family protein [Candidatus Humimicrobiaceae bacterium]
MNSAIKTMLDRYNLKSSDDYENALKEIIQEIALLGLWRAKFFEKAAFYGGTALRLLYGLDRFSEDIDFSLLKSDQNFKIDDYSVALGDELSSFGFSVVVERKVKSFESNIESAFIKAGTLKNLITIEAPSQLLKKLSNTKTLKVKIEVDIEPPSGFETEAKYLLNPIPFSVNTYKIPYLFAGKMHAILCRGWKTRVKGRDWYDFVWHVGKNARLNLKHLESRMRQTGHLLQNDILSKKKFLELLDQRIENVDFEKAKNDVAPFLKDQGAVLVWSKSFFREVAKRVEFE